MSAPDLMKKLLDYVLEQAKTVDPRAFRLTGHTGFLKAHADLQGLPGVTFDVQEDGDHIWLKVARLEAHPPPAVAPLALLGSAKPTPAPIVVSSAPNGPTPSIDDVAFQRLIALLPPAKPEDLVERNELIASSRAALASALERYIPLWEAWAEGEKPRRKTISLYGDLFSLKHQLEAEETAKPHELVWGIGVSSWKLNFTERLQTSIVDFQYPLITQAMEIGMDDKTLDLEVRPRSIGPQFSFDAFSACQLSSAPEVEKSAREALRKSADRPVSPFDPGSFEHLLKLIAGNLHDKGRYEQNAEAFPKPSEDLVVSDAWVLLARPKSANFLQDDIERLKGRLAPGVEIPMGPLALVTAPSDEPAGYATAAFRGLSGTSAGHGASGEVQELFFPLPYNHEQVTIVEQLERAPGVTVQGPPGTGKTHTIANIVCHYLATGRKVLVNSKGEQALEVLQSKIPEQVRPLTVALLSGDREGMRQFQGSIEAIIHNVSQLNPEGVREQIRNDHSGIDRAHAELAKIDRRVDEIAMAQLSDIEVDGERMRAQRMAELVISGADKHAWFDDVLSLDPAHAPPVDSGMVGQTREARRRLGKDLVYSQARIPSSLNMLAADQVSELHTALVNLRQIEAAEADGGLLALRAMTPEVLEDARRLLSNVESARQLARDIEESGELWTRELRKKCGQISFASERAAFEALFPDIDQLLAARAELLKTPVEASEAALASPKVREAVQRAAETGKPFGLLSFGGGDVKELVATIRTSGLAPTTADQWGHVQRYMRLHEKVLSFGVRWNQVADLLSLPNLQGGVSALRQIELVASLARTVHTLATVYDAHSPTLAERVFSKPPIDQLLGTSAQLGEVEQQLRSHLGRIDLAKAATTLVVLQERLAGSTGPVSDALRGFVAVDLGNVNTPVERATARYAELVADIRRAEALAPDLALVNDVADRMEKAGAAKLSARVRTQQVDASGEDSALPVSWREAWTWSRARAHLEAIESRQELRELAARRRDLEVGMARLYESVVSKSAWLSTKLGATSKVLAALGKYSTAMRRIGQGTGPNATRYRRDAQAAMLEAQGAVPCWIMSHAKVSETLPAQLGAIDLVVVDEASQSDLWALPAVLRGKKILVVGDDKQVSPDGGFISSVRIQELRDRFLSEQPFAAVLTPEMSLYDIASAVFAANKVMLREHFRCVPPIIGYSNTFYDNQIQPLRIPKASERIDPPLVDIFVPGGTRGPKADNKLEAECIVEEIAAIVKNPALADRTIGVVSLLGMEQAKRIDSLVRERIDAKELMRRKFDVGDARLFQGSERDIMFLSMVVEPNAKAVSGNAFEQRFNVAASRARDRMYLVRSVQMSDLSQADLRRGLLGHFSKPEIGRVQRSEDSSLIDLCESGFEKQVFKELHSRGYLVVPQVKAGAFRIDMVVEGADDARLAIECDGDEYHGPDRWQADMSRQRILERAGWTFWRCFASTWSLQRDAVLEDLMERLRAMGIEPLGALDRVPSLVEYREWGGPQSNSADSNLGLQALEEVISASPAMSGFVIPSGTPGATQADDGPANFKIENAAP
ncbi:MAG: AAA family ATPase [Pseudomonadota bacterium]|nr:AAA family ATPase [Pseudomonadota bacterium]